MTFGVRPLSTRSITDRTGGYEPPDGEFDSPRVYMNCDWCSETETAKHIGVFGSLITMNVWDVRLCQQHADTVRYQKPRRGEPIWAPLHYGQAHDQSHYADDWLIR